MNPTRAEKKRAFVTCAVRAASSVGPLVELAEVALHEAGVRTRVPHRAPQRQGLSLEERRRVRMQTYEEIERSTVVVHVPAPGGLDGTSLHRELQHACRCGVPVLVLLAAAERNRLGLELPPARRIQELVDLTRGEIVETVADLVRVVARLPVRLAPPTAPPPPA